MLNVLATPSSYFRVSISSDELISNMKIALNSEQCRALSSYLGFSQTCSETWNIDPHFLNYWLWQISSMGDQSGIRRIKSKKYANFISESGKLAIQIKDDYYINWKNARIEKIFNNFP